MTVRLVVLRRWAWSRISSVTPARSSPASSSAPQGSLPVRVQVPGFQFLSNPLQAPKKAYLSIARARHIFGACLHQAGNLGRLPALYVKQEYRYTLHLIQGIESPPHLGLGFV